MVFFRANFWDFALFTGGVPLLVDRPETGPFTLSEGSVKALLTVSAMFMSSALPLRQGGYVSQFAGYLGLWCLCPIFGPSAPSSPASPYKLLGHT